MPQSVQTLVDEEPHVGDENGEPPFSGKEVPVRDDRGQPLHDFDAPLLFPLR